MTNSIYLPEYFNKYKMKEHIVESQDIIHKRGIFSIKYTKEKRINDNIFGKGCWKDSYPGIKIFFYENDILLFEKISNNEPGIVIHGDGINRDKTFFTIIEKFIYSYNMNNEYIKRIDIGGDYSVDFKRVNEKYAIGYGQESCTFSNFTALFNLDILFGLDKINICEPYDNRVYFTMDLEDESLLVIPIIARENGFEVKKIVEGEYSWLSKNNIVSYDDMFNRIADIHYYEDSDSEDI
jgi:hypothetical protein